MGICQFGVGKLTSKACSDTFDVGNMKSTGVDIQSAGDDIEWAPQPADLAGHFRL
jgi:hypothetical protein